MATIAKNTSGLSALKLLEKASGILTQMDGNAAFPDPVPALAEITTAVEALQLAQISTLDGSRLATAMRNQRRTELRQRLNQLGDYVGSVAKGDATIIQSSGFDVRRTGAPAREPESPRDLRARISDHKGRVDLRWLPAVPAVTYHIEHSSTDPEMEANWKLVGVSTRSRYSVKGLPSGAMSYFRVAGIGTAGVGPWSQVASTLVR
jgi:hypothetical protein